MIKLIAFILLFLSSSAFANTPEYIQSCMDCHGEKGISSESDMPTIAGASATFIEYSLYAYLDDMRPAIESKYRMGDTDRPATDMKKVAQNLSEEQILEVAEYFSKLPFVPAKQDFDPKWAEVGKKIHDRSCKKCHEDGGSSAADDSGILAGQWTPYLEETIKHIIDGSRKVDKKMMQKMEGLTDKHWQALLHYYASQQD